MVLGYRRRDWLGYKLALLPLPFALIYGLISSRLGSHTSDYNGGLSNIALL